MAAIPRHIVEQTHNYMRELVERDERRRRAANLGGTACNATEQTVPERVPPAEITDVQTDLGAVAAAKSVKSQHTA